MDMSGGSDHPSLGQIDQEMQDQSTDEEVVNKYFYKLYMSQINTDQMIEIMRHLNDSAKGSRNRNIYSTMLKILFNECRFFPKYPVQELAITAELFGKMIKSGLLLSNGPLLLLASRCILEALKRGRTSKMFQFGTIALSQFETSIASFPWFSNALLEIPEVKETFPQLYRTCEKLQSIMGEGMKNNAYVDQARGIVITMNEAAGVLPTETREDSGRKVGLDRRSESNNSSLNSVHKQDTLSSSVPPDEKLNVGECESLMASVGDELSLVVPNDHIVNQIYSIFNNICMDSVVQRASEVRNLLAPNNYSWLILYIVRTRASKEHNLHETFASFIENLHYPKVFDLAIQVTYLCVTASLKNLSEYKEIVSYRTLLKNLGSWLGRITLARNVPIILRQLDVKGLLFSGYESGTLIAILPFVCRVMEGIKNSKIFKPPNPWTTAILSFLAEIHKLEFLKTNLVFEIEVLFKHLSLDIAQFENKTDLLSAKTRAKVTPDFDTDSLVNPDEGIRTNPIEISKERLNQLLSRVMRDGVTVTADSPTTLDTNVASVNNTVGIGGLETSSNIERLLQSIHTSVVISPSIALFDVQPQLRALVPLAIERAIRHVLPIVSDHSLSLARTTTRELILKDFHAEEDGNVLRNVTKLVFENLASSLVSASCKEPLRISFHESLRAALQTHRTQDCNDQVLIEQLVQITSQDNLALSVNIIENIVLEQVQAEAELLALEIIKVIKKGLQPGIMLPPLLQHWNNRNTQRDGHGMNVYNNIFAPVEPTEKVPDATTEPTPVQAIGKCVSDNVMALCEECLADLREPLRDIALFPPTLYLSGPTEADMEPHVFSTHSLHVLYSLPSDHELFSCMAQCLSVVEMSSQKDSVSVAISRCLLMFLCEGLGNHAGLNVEVLLCILNGLYTLNPVVKQILTTMLLSLPLDQGNNLFDIVVVTGLLRYDLLEWSDLTQYLIMAMDRGKNSYAVEMAIMVMAISLIDQRSSPPECGAILIREIASISCGPEPCRTYPDVLLKDAWSKLLKDYVDIKNHPKPTITSLVPILRRNLADKMNIHGFKIKGASGMGYGGVRRVPLPFALSEGHKSIVSLLFSKWIEASLPYEGESLLFAWKQFFQRFNLQNLFKMEGGTDSFFSACVYTVIDVPESGSDRDEILTKRGFVLAKMVDVMLRLVVGADLPPSSALQKLLSAISSIIVHEESQYCCYKLWNVLLNYFDKFEDKGLCKVTFLNGLECINPTRVPSFAFFWFKLLSNRSMLNALRMPKCWSKYSKLFSLASSFFNVLDTVESVSTTPQYNLLKDIYKNLVTNICLSSPEFVSFYYLSFSGSRTVERLASACHVQSGASYANMLKSNFNTNLILEMKPVPRLPGNILVPIIRNGVKILIERILKSGEFEKLPDLTKIGDSAGLDGEGEGNASVTSSSSGKIITSKLQSDLERLASIIESELDEYPSDGIATLNALVLYLGIFKVEEGNNRLLIYLWLLRNMSLKGKYHLICSLSRHLRYPNAHTHFFSCLVLWLFDECKASEEETKLVILRVLLEWFIAPGPCPWGVSLVVVEIFRNPRFTHYFNNLNASPKVGALFESMLDLLNDTI